jgi:hypothetical protein
VECQGRPAKPLPGIFTLLPEKNRKAFLFHKRRLSYKRLTEFTKPAKNIMFHVEEAKPGFGLQPSSPDCFCPLRAVKGKDQPNKGGKTPMMSQIPIILSKVRQADLDKEILRAAIIAEYDAINMYEQLANMTDNAHLKTVLLDIAKEEKTHVGEFHAMLLRLDNQQKEELAHGQEEVEELVGKL